MSYLELTYQNFISRISEVNKKDTLLGLSRKVLLFIIFAITLAFIFISAEAIFEFSQSARKILFFSYLSLIFTSLLYIIYDTFNMYSRIGKPERIRFYAGKIGRAFPDVKDNLLNALQIYEDANTGRLMTSKDLAAESIVQVDERTKPYNFNDTISFNSNRRLAFISSAVVVIFIALLLAFPNVFQASANRIIDYNYSYVENTLGIAYEVKPGNIEISKGDNVDLFAKINFNDPNYKTDKISLYTRVLSGDGIELTSDNENVESSTPNEFKYTLTNISAPTEYWFEYKGIKSTVYKISVTSRPVIKNVKVTIYPPAYTKLPSRVAEGNEITTIAGSRIYIELEASDNLSRSAVMFAGSAPQGLEVNGSKSVGSFTAMQSGNFRLSIARMFGDKELTNLNSPEFNVIVYPDEYPKISIVEPNSTSQVKGEKEILVRSRISDDFGFSKMRIGYKLAKSKYGVADKDYQYADIPVKNTDATGLEVPYIWNLSPLNLGTEDEVEYFVEVYDNDAVSGPKSARSDVFKLIYPSFESMFEKTEKSKEEIENSIKSAYDDAMDLKQELDEIKDKLDKNPEEMGLNDPKKAQELQNKIENLQNQLSNTQQKMNELMNDLQNNNQISKETLDKFMELQKMFQQIDSKELREALKKLQEAMKNMNAEQMKEAMKNFKFDEETFKKSMEKTMELLKKIMNEQKFGELTKKLDEITKNQDQLKENTKNTDEQDKNKMNELSKTQEQLRKEMEEFQKQMKELSENMKKLKDDQISKEMQKLLSEMMKKMLEQKMKQSSQNLEQGNKNQSQQQQNQLSQDLNEMNQQMQDLLAQMLQNENAQTMQKLQEILDKLQQMSEKEGQLKEQSKDLDPKKDGKEFNENAQQQNQLSQQLSNTMEELMSMSQQLGNQLPMLGKNLGDAYNEMNEATESLKNKDGKSANKSQGDAKESLDKAIEKMKAMCKNGMQPGKGSSLQQLLQGLQDMIARQQSLNNQMGQMGQNGNQGKLSEQEMAQMQRLAMEQETIKKNLQNMNEDLKQQQEKDGKKLLGNLDEIQKDMMEVIKDLQDNNITPETKKRQEKILSRMLDFQLSAREKDFEQKRESRPGKDFDRVSPPEIIISRPEVINGINQDALDLQKESYSDEYELLIRKYMQKIKSTSKEK
ncbi:MAG: hypothetical protein EHM58_16145 [Ignavibacteriae bacterium]|nr:MAG: hypothetical protein EHM58_16145 [Ignavibacteriota bacterium]